MFTYQILIEYVGTKYVGWQKQKNSKSVQETIEKALKKIVKKKIKVYGSGRTDAGVHAIEQSAHFQTNDKIDHILKFIKSINFFLSNSEISILKIKKRKNTFHARYSATQRTYKYLIINRESYLAIEKNRAWNVRKTLNIKLMKNGAKILKNTKDFSTFRSSSCGAKNSIRKLEKVKIKKEKNKIELTFVSRSFLQQQVRSMVGCLKYLGEQKWSTKKFKQVADSRKRTDCAPPAPPHGLYLAKVSY
jgi:tRNA pseudouridine38-40 synthase